MIIELFQGSVRMVCSLILGCLVFLSTSSFAQEQSEKTTDVRLIIDISGSMKLNDPANLRRPAVDLLVKLLPEGSTAGVWTFGKQVNMLIPHKPVTESWRQAAIIKANKINSVGLYTNIGDALEKSTYDSTYSTAKNFNTSLILLTDGMVDISKDPAKNQSEWRRIVEGVLPKLKAAGITVHTIALSENADQALLSQLSMATDGLDAVANDADELMQIFLQAFNKAAPAEQLPFDGESFLVDSSVEEFTALIFYQAGSKPTQLIAPDKSIYSEDASDSSVRWFAGDGYDLVTVKRPFEGEWRVRADVSPNSRITVVSDLSLKVMPMANNLKPGQSLDLSLLFKEDGKKITSADFLGLLDVDLELSGAGRWNQSLSEDGVPQNGIYSTQLDQFHDNGNYHLVINVDGKTFKRRFEHSINVRSPFAAELMELEEVSVPTYQLKVGAPGQDLDFNSAQLTVAISKPDGGQDQMFLDLLNEHEWSLDYQPGINGEYSFTVKVRGQMMDGSQVAESLAPIALTVNNELLAPISGPEQPAVEEPMPEEPTVEEFAESDNANLIKIAIAGGITLLLIAVGFFAIRKMYYGKKEDTDAEEDDFVNVNESESELEIESIDDDIDGIDPESVVAPEAVVEPEVTADPVPVVEPEAVAAPEPEAEPEPEVAAAVESVTEADSVAVDVPTLSENVSDAEAVEPVAEDPVPEQDQTAPVVDEPQAEPSAEESIVEASADEEAMPEVAMEEEEAGVDGMGMDDMDDETKPEPEVAPVEDTAEEAKENSTDEVDDIDALLDAVAQSSEDNDEDFDIDALLAEEGGLDISSDDAVEKM